MKELKLWISILDSLVKSKIVALIIVAESSNSSPGKQGFKMAINEDEVLFGTIGGGIMERDLLNTAQENIKNNRKSFIKTLYHNQTDNNESSGMICGGKQTFIFNYLDDSSINLVSNIISVLESQTRSVLVNSQNGIFVQTNISQTEKFVFNYAHENIFEYKEIYGIPDTVYIIGGGHVGLALSKVMANLDFYIVIVDHRDEVFTMDENIYAHKKIILDYDKIGNVINDGTNTFIAIVSPQHIGDEAALKSVLHKNVKYIGMMGSKKKIKTIFDNLIGFGIKKDLLDKVHSPIGLEIGAQTPEEIAISIAAEIIKTKYEIN